MRTAPSRSCRWIPLAAALLLLSCAKTFNYTDPAGPRYAGGEAAPEAVAAGNGEIRLVTFNVQWARRIDRTCELLRTNSRLKDADLVFLQEMDAEGARRIAECLSMGYVYYPAVLHPHNHKDFGNAILSRWPIVEDHKLVLPHLGRTRRSQRIAVGATVLLNGVPVRVYCVHLAAPFELGATARRDQFLTVVQDSGDGPAIIAGDMNSACVAEEGFLRGFLWLTPDLGSTELVFDFDHILARGFVPAGKESAGVVRHNLGASDHRPVWAVVKPWSRRPAGASRPRSGTAPKTAPK